MKLETLARSNFWIFFRDIFSLSLKEVEGKFVYGNHFKEWCDELQNYKRTAIQSARNHAKTTAFRAYIMWLMYRFQSFYYEGLFLSYKVDLAEYHLKRVNSYISVNPYFKSFKKLTDAETIVFYQTQDGRKFSFEPDGIMAFKRGRHPDCVLADDILKDNQDKLDITQISKIGQIFQNEVQSLPKADGMLHVRGTPQDERDIFSELKKDKRFYCKEYPAVLDDLNQKVLWPEMFPYETLMSIKQSIRDKAFNREYLCKPVRSTESYFTPDEIREVINPELVKWDYRLDHSAELAKYDIRAGYDIGKKRHPSHFCVFRKEGDRLVEMLSFFMDEWDYIRQVDFVKRCIQHLNINLVVYDNTRAELESLFEMGELPKQMVPMTFTTRTKYAMATALEKFVVGQKIQLLSDERQNNQLLGVDNDLKSIETIEGHADSFWSLAMCAEAFEQSMLTYAKPVFEGKVLDQYIPKVTKPIHMGQLKFNAQKGIIDLERLPDGQKPKVLIWTRPIEELEYRIGVCVPEDLDRPAVACVRELESGKLTAIYYSRLDAEKLAEDLDLLGRYYNNAPMAIIANPKGIPVLDVLEKEIAYPYIYYDVVMDGRTDVQTRKLGYILNDKSYNYLVDIEKRSMRACRIDMPSFYLIDSHRQMMQDPSGKIYGKLEEYSLADMLSVFLIDKIPNQEIPYYAENRVANSVTGY